MRPTSTTLNPAAKRNQVSITSRPSLSGSPGTCHRRRCLRVLGAAHSSTPPCIGWRGVSQSSCSEFRGWLVVQTVWPKAFCQLNLGDLLSKFSLLGGNYREGSSRRVRWLTKRRRHAVSCTSRRGRSLVPTHRTYSCRVYSWIAQATYNMVFQYMSAQSLLLSRALWRYRSPQV